MLPRNNGSVVTSVSRVTGTRGARKIVRDRDFRGSWLRSGVIFPPHSSSLRLFRHAIDAHSARDSTITNGIETDSRKLEDRGFRQRGGEESFFSFDRWFALEMIVWF